MDNLRNRIAALFLSAVMALSMSGFAFIDVFAVENEGKDAQTTDQPYQEEASDPDEDLAEVEKAQEPKPDGDAETANEVTNDEEGDAAEKDAAGGLRGVSAADTNGKVNIQETVNITVNKCANRTIEVSWGAVAGAEYYQIIKDSDAPVQTYGLGYIFTGLDPKTPHYITVRAYKAGGVIAEGTTGAQYAYVDGNTNRAAVGGGGRSPANLGVNLRALLGEGHDGYSVVQGSATDGTYAYYLMVSSSNQKGRVLKTRISDNVVMARSGVIDICHGNGMALDTARNRLVVVGREGRRNQLTVINVGTGEYDVPTLAGYVNVDYSFSSNWTTNKGKFDDYGLAAISYVEKYDCFIALQRTTHELLVLDPNFRVIGTIHTTVSAAYPGTYQAMDADERYVYLLLSYYSSAQPNNCVLVMEWHGGMVADVTNGKAEYVSSAWSCGSDGTPSSVIYTNTPYEAESIYHIYDEASGTSRVFLSEYYNNPQYKTVTKKQAYKVKWKKVWKKVKVKWKKVKKKGKKKKVWKYKYKKKKVWKYKTKYKKVKVQELSHYNRDNFVYDLGVM